MSVGSHTGRSSDYYADPKGRRSSRLAEVDRWALGNGTSRALGNDRRASGGFKSRGVQQQFGLRNAERSCELMH